MNRVALYPIFLVMSRLASRWKYAILVSLVVAAVIVPSSDIKAMYIYAAPILALSVGVVWLVQRDTSR
jgi:Sec-independent protein secretion pathway component TatC